MAAAAQPSESGLTEAQEDFGEHRALELIYTGRLLNGTEATEWDLVNRAVPEDESLDETLAVARRVAAARHRRSGCRSGSRIASPTPP
jgi:enoyl-CoA hydratase/carnithine racemase